MNFLTAGYLLFFPVVLLLYFLLPRLLKNAWLLAASWFFCLCAGADCFAFLLCAALLTWGGALLLERCAPRKKRPLLCALLIILFGTLFLFKYLSFALSLASRLLSVAGLAFSSPALDLILPAGISFYLFAASGYLIDVYRGRQSAERSFPRCALFLSFFPHLISGPIPRAGELLPQFGTPHSFDYDKFRMGLLRFLWGAFKKLCIADRLAIAVNTVFGAPSDAGSLQVIAAACAFSVQIYCDFSAYSDMATGCAEAMGFRLAENFRTPYFSRSIAEFWRRWHISLSSWFRDYLYIPLGGSRRGQARRYLNLLIVFAVSGLWHGAGLTFLTWGLLNGLYQVLGALSAKLRARCRGVLRLKPESRLLALWQMAVTFALSTLAWVFFKAGSLSHALEIFRAMLLRPRLVHPMLETVGLDHPEFFAGLISVLILLAVDLLSLRICVRERFLSLPRLLRWIIALGLLLIVCVFGIYGTGYDPQDFIYFKF